jgi:hypothetical protein
MSQPKSKVHYKEKNGHFFINLSHINVMSPKQIYDPKLTSFSQTTYIV